MSATDVCAQLACCGTPHRMLLGSSANLATVAIVLWVSRAEARWSICSILCVFVVLSSPIRPIPCLGNNVGQPVLIACMSSKPSS